MPVTFIQFAAPPFGVGGSFSPVFYGIAPATDSDASGEFDVYMYAAYRDGADYMAVVRR